jgi:molecular chaperone GrpE
MSDEEKNIEEKQNAEAPEQPAEPGFPVAEKSETELLNERIAELDAQVLQLKDQVLRKAAEFENYKRRSENDIASLVKYASENIISSLLPILDDLSRSLKNGKEKLGDDPYYKGIELIYQKLLKILEAQGLRAMEVEGKEFSVNFHDALLQVPRSDIPPHTILQEVDRGYYLFDKVLRHAKVIVSSAPTTESVAEQKRAEGSGI